MAHAARPLEQRIKDQDETLESALRFVKQGGSIVYITCSVLRAENEDRIAAFLARHDDLLPIDATAQANSAGLPALAEHQSTLGPGIRLTPERLAPTGFISRRWPGREGADVRRLATSCYPATLLVLFSERSPSTV